MTDLANIEGIRPIYFLPEDNLAGEVLIPCLSASQTFDCMVGFFSSRAFVQLAPGLASFLAEPERKLRLIVSPYLLRSDREAIENGLKAERDAVEESLNALFTSEEGIVRHTCRCISYLIAHERLQMKIVVMEDAIFHLKAWLVSRGGDRLAAHGSGNFTEAGLKKNYEQITVSRSWIDSNQCQIVESLQRRFDAIWNCTQTTCRVFDLPDAIRLRLLRDYPVDQPPTEEEYLRLVANCGGFESENVWGYDSGAEVDDYNRFMIPSHLSYREGDYAHQGEAVDAWCGNNYRGVLEMATGSGKTIAAMVATLHLHKKTGRLLVVVAAPYLPLIDQWCDEVRRFGITPVNLSSASNKRRIVAQSKRRLRHKTSDVEVLVVTHDTLCNQEFVETLEDCDAPMLLIADEVHNLGRKSFIGNPPEMFRYRLGLSATPVRQYDPEGTTLLTEYFGEIVYRFTLENAIGKCLVPYDYFVHRVLLTEEEEERWLDLTEKIKRMASMRDDGDESNYLEKLLRDRRLVLEAAANKITALSELIGGRDPRTIRHTLIYATDKDPVQLDKVNSLLGGLRILYRQLTAEETSDKKKTRQILRSFRNGDLSILTAKRVLDEGVNVPEIATAYILASTTVERQWVQRRGRVLRKCGEIGKDYATIHDFLALPPTLQDSADPDLRKILKQELRRTREFASLARNAGKPDGASAVIHEIISKYF